MSDRLRQLREKPGAQFFADGLGDAVFRVFAGAHVGEDGRQALERRAPVACPLSDHLLVGDANELVGRVEIVDLALRIAVDLRRALR